VLYFLLKETAKHGPTEISISEDFGFGYQACITKKALRDHTAYWVRPISIFFVFSSGDPLLCIFVRQ